LALLFRLEIYILTKKCEILIMIWLKNAETWTKSYKIRINPLIFCQYWSIEISNFQPLSHLIFSSFFCFFQMNLLIQHIIYVSKF
jgi:hypothetical protein